MSRRLFSKARKSSKPHEKGLDSSNVIHDFVEPLLRRLCLVQRALEVHILNVAHVVQSQLVPLPDFSGHCEQTFEASFRSRGL